MKPIDFVVFDGNSSPHTPAYKVAEAMNKDIEIHGYTEDFEILSYYLDEDKGKMVLDVQPKSDT